MMTGKNRSLAAKLVAWGAVMAVIVLILSVYSIYRLSVLQGYIDKSYLQATVPLKDCAQFVMTFSKVMSKLNYHISVGDAKTMEESESEMEAALKEADGYLRRLGDATDTGELKKQWESVAALVRNAVTQSKEFRKFEALNALNSGEGLQQILALNEKTSRVLSEAVKDAEEYQNISQELGRRTRNYMIVASVLAVFVSVLIGLMLARSIGGPLKTLSNLAAKISDGDLTVEIPLERRGDELGSLAQAFVRMLASLKDQSKRMIEVVSTLSTLASELSTTMSQLVQNASKTSAAVSEVTTTISQVSQSAKVANTKARNVVDSSQQALTISDSGRQATQMTVERMSVIRDQMTSIGETVVRLSEQSRAIEDIIVSVQDLADQSNLLAVNASIEAARAGDQGKGFAVVAQEIKTLADQSKEATDQIRTILDETRKCVSAVVMATEQGGKAVDSGVEQSVLAGEAIASLVGGVANSAQAASVISTSSEEQLAGTEQASNAMVSIEQAVREHLDGTSQVSEAAKKLQELGDTLDKLVKYYKV